MANDNEHKEHLQTQAEAANDLREFFIDQLKDIYWAEKALVKALPKMVKNATAQELVHALNDHLAVTEHQADRIEQVFELLGKPVEAKKCEAMSGLIREAKDIMDETTRGPVRDAGIIAACQKIEHYEMASYGTLTSFAKILGESDAVELLQKTLDEEKEADARLTLVAEDHINLEALEADDEPI